ncbi:MAG TPA: hypothetical protein VE954_10445 [Oligoflexus sp.]|uniref:hypothetical protein n=1 Tax=Oligoflexus sp. TaxID=1971216 RepID=UPI002D431CD7|nr:hypothetical protein [Oligoflexus sp.]HYX33523.1 hypothetical protein [Oligoflexus sp.]
MLDKSRLVSLIITLYTIIGFQTIENFFPGGFATIVWGCKALDAPCTEFAQDLDAGVQCLVLGFVLVLIYFFEPSSPKLINARGEPRFHIVILSVISAILSLWSFHAAFGSFNGTSVSSRENAQVYVMILILSSLLVYSIFTISVATLSRFLSRKFPSKS